MNLKHFFSRLKWYNLLGFIISLSSFVFSAEINKYFIYLSFIYSPDNGQYIIMYIGALLGLYGINEPVVKLFVAMFSSNLFDELTERRIIIDWKAYENNYMLLLDILTIFVLAILNYKNIKR